MIYVSSNSTAEWETARQLTTYLVNVLIVQMGKWRWPKVMDLVDGEELALIVGCSRLWIMVQVARETCCCLISLFLWPELSAFSLFPFP